MPDAPSSRVTVSIPFFGCHRFVHRAVESILAQTHADLRLVVVNDGDPVPPWDALADVGDPRLVRFDLAANHGRYFADQVVLAATPDAYFAIQDADDWSEPRRLGRLLETMRAEGASGATSAIRFHYLDGERIVRAGVRHFPDVQAPLTPELQHRASHHGLFRTSALRDVGGYYGGFRISYDTLIVNLLLLTGRLAYVDAPLYNRLVRLDSLSTAAATGIGSPARQDVRRRLQDIYAAALAARHEAAGGDPPRLAASIRQLIAAGVPPAERAVLDEEAARLATILRATETAPSAGSSL